MSHARLTFLISSVIAVALATGRAQLPEIALQDTFDEGVLAPHWSFDARPFETGTIDIGGGIIDGAMQLEVTALSDFWGGFAPLALG